MVLTLRSVSALGTSAGWAVSGDGSTVGTREEMKLGRARWAGLRLTFWTYGEAGD